jgi:2-keto-4-pentenoate hydratase/2-oxohepta-3-ene-1,7-dioic acid hydratase in catechol pathway
MRIVRFRRHDTVSYGIVDGEDVYQVEGDPFQAATAQRRLGRLDEVTLLAPVQPSKIIGIGKNYMAHAAELESDVPDEPLMFLKPPTAVIGPNDTIVCPSLSERVDHEGELAVVIGRQARNITADQAPEYVLGYTCGNDVTARDLQQRESQWVRGKGIETDLNPAAVTVITRVNGEVRQEGNTADMVFNIPSLVATASRVMTLLPGDVIMTGTPAGVGPLHPGDIVEVDVEGIGVLRNHVAAEE